MDDLDFQTWMAYGQEKGWIAEGNCQTHDVTPMTDEEEQEWEDGGDPCIPILRVWIDAT